MKCFASVRSLELRPTTCLQPPRIQRREGGDNLITTILISALVSVIVSRVAIAIHFITIDKYIDEMQETVRKLYDDTIAILSKHL